MNIMAKNINKKEDTMRYTSLHAPRSKIRGLVFICLLFLFPNHLCANSFINRSRLTSKDQKEKKEKDVPHFKFGGALRFNYRFMNWSNEEYARINKAQGGEFLLDTYRINVNGSYKSLRMSLEYRFYSGYNMLHHGYFAYDFDKNNEIQLGITKAPFGILPYASHNWFFSIAYYIGLEDNYAAGLKYIHKNGPLNIQFAFYKNSGGNYIGNSTSSSRYSYDIVPNAGSDLLSYNRETNQINARLTYAIIHGELGNTTVGVSGMYGGLYNSKIDKMGYQSAFGLHLNGKYGRWNLMAFVYVMNDAPEYSANENKNIVVMGAYDFPFAVAKKGILYSAEIAYKIPVNWGPITGLTLYNDFSMFDKDQNNFHTTYHNITGVAIAAGNLYTYIDYANGINNPWLGQFKGLAQGVKNAKWKTRFNINFGFYF